MVTPKLGVAAILCWYFIIQKRKYSERVNHITLIAFDPLEYSSFCIIIFQHKMDATPNFGVNMISEEHSNPQLTLKQKVYEIRESPQAK